MRGGLEKNDTEDSIVASWIGASISAKHQPLVLSIGLWARSIYHRETEANSPQTALFKVCRESRADGLEGGVMGGYYPDGVTQASFDRYWDDKLDDPEDDYGDAYPDRFNDPPLSPGPPEHPIEEAPDWKEK